MKNITTPTGETFKFNEIWEAYLWIGTRIDELRKIDLMEDIFMVYFIDGRKEEIGLKTTQFNNEIPTAMRLMDEGKISEIKIHTRMFDWQTKKYIKTFYTITNE